VIRFHFICLSEVNKVTNEKGRLSQDSLSFSFSLMNEIFLNYGKINHYAKGD